MIISPVVGQSIDQPSFSHLVTLNPYLVTLNPCEQLL